MKHKLLLWAACIATFSASVSAATDDKVIEEKLARYNISVESIKPSPIVGLNTIDTSDGIIYVTDDGKYLLQGPIYDLSGKMPVNISTQKLKSPQPLQNGTKVALGLVKLSMMNVRRHHPP